MPSPARTTAHRPRQGSRENAIEHSSFWARPSHQLLERLDTTVGGPARRQVAIVLSLVLALSSADTAAVGSTSTQLQHSLGIGR